MEDIKIRLALDGADQVQAGAQRAAEGLRRFGQASAQAGQQTQLSGQQMAQVSAQLQDLFVQIQGGQAPLTAIIQQGSQLSAVFGGIGNAARAVASLISPAVAGLSLLAAAVGGAALAYNQGANEGQAFARALILSGNAAGTTVGQLQALAQAQARVVGTQGDAAEALAALAQSGLVSRVALDSAAEAAVRFSRVGGDLGKVVDKFAELGKDPLAALIKFNEAENFLTESVYRQVKALTEQGRTAEAAAIAQETYAATLTQRSKQIEAGLGTLESGWKKVKDGARSAWDAMLNIGRPETLQDQLKDTEAKIAAAQAKLEEARSGRLKEAKPYIDVERVIAAQQRELAALGQRAAALRENIGLDNEAALAQESRGRSVKALIKADEDAAKAARELNAERERDAAALEKAVGLSGSYQKDLAEIYKLRQQGKLTEEQYVAAVERLIKAQPIVHDQLQAQAAAQKEAAKALEDLMKADQRRIDQQYKIAEQVADQVQKLQDEEAAIAVSAQQHVSLAAAIELVRVARLEEAAAKATAAQDYAGAAALRAEIENREKLAKLLDDKDVRAASKKSAEEAAREWKRASDEIERTLTDSLMRGFEAGKGFAQNLRDTVVNLFKTLILRPTIQAIVQPIAGSLLGGASSAASAAGSAGGALGGLGSLSSLLGLQGVGSALSGGAQLTLNGGTGLALEGAGSLIGSGNILQGLAQGAGALGPIAALLAASYYGGKAISGGLSIGGLGGSGGLSAALSLGGGAILGPLGALVGGLGGGLINRAFGRGPVEARDSGIQGSIGGGDLTGQLFQDWFQKGGWFRSNKSGTNFAALDAATEAGIDASAKAILVNTTAWAQALQLPAEQLASITTTFKTKLTGNADEDQKAIAGILQSYSDALTGGFEAQLAPFRASTETAAQTLERLAGSLTGVNGVLSVLGQSLYTVSAAGGDAASKLLEQFGSLQAFQQAGAQYLQDYYSQSERTALATQELTTQLSAVGVAMPASRDAFRQLVEAQDRNTDSGRKAYATLLQLAPAFAALVPAAESAADAAAKLAADAAAAAAKMVEAGRRVLADLTAEQGGLQVELLRAQGNLTAAADLARQQALAKLVDGLSEADAAAATAAYDYNLALRGQIDALVAAKDAAEQAAQAEASRTAAVASQRDGIQAQIDQLLGNTEAIRARELAGLDESNKALMERYYQLLDQKAAEDAAARASEQAAQAAAEAARAADQVRNAWKSITDTLVDEVNRIRGVTAGQGAVGRAQAQAQFAVATAQARAGDQEAAKLLPNLSRTLLDLVEQTATSRAEVDRAQAQVAASLESTAAALGNAYGFSVTTKAASSATVTPTPVDVQQILSQIQATAPIINASLVQQQTVQSTQQGVGELVEEIKTLRAELQTLRDDTSRTAGATERTRDLLILVTDNGNAMQVEQA